MSIFALLFCISSHTEYVQLVELYREFERCLPVKLGSLWH